MFKRKKSSSSTATKNVKDVFVRRIRKKNESIILSDETEKVNQKEKRIDSIFN